MTASKTVNEALDSYPRLDKNIALIAEKVRSCLQGLADAKLSTSFYYHSLPLCVIDAVWSMGVRYQTVRNVVERWCKHNGWSVKPRPSSKSYTIGDFLDLTRDTSAGDLATLVYKNRCLTSTTNGILKADAVNRFAQQLSERGINSFDDLKACQTVCAARDAVMKIPGQKSGLSFGYFLMLAGDDQQIKPDTWIKRFVAAALDRQVAQVGDDDARRLLTGVAEVLKKDFPEMSPRLLDHSIWNYMRSPTSEWTQHQKG